MPIATRLTELLKVQHPILLAPMDVVADGKLVQAYDWPIGTIHSLAISSDGKLLALSTGVSGRPMPGGNNCYIIKMPEVAK